MTTGSSSTSSATADGGGISTFRGQERALRADRLGTGGLLLSVLAATAPSWWSQVSCPLHSR